MHPDETPVSAHLARHLIAQQMPDLAHLPLRRVGKTGTDNVLYRVGAQLLARFPRRAFGAAEVAHLARWLPHVAPGLPLAVPLATHSGPPGPAYPFAWSLGPWLPGRDAFAAPPDQMQAARDLARFLTTLHRLPAPQDAPQRGDATGLPDRLTAAETYLPGFVEEGDPAHLRHTLAQARALPLWTGPPVWVHGDLHALNLLTRRGRLSAVIDWGGMGLGDPAMDLFAGWTLFDPPARAVFHDLMQPDPATWARARAQALAKSIMAIPYYRQSNPLFYRANLVTLGRILSGAAT